MWLIYDVLDRRHLTDSGISAAVVDWRAARAQNRRGASQTFGKGRRTAHRVRELNNAKEGGARSTIAFGVRAAPPGRPARRVPIHDLVPGPDMLTRISASPIRWCGPWRSPTFWRGPCYVSPLFAKIATLRYTLIPGDARHCLHRRLEASRQWGDLITLLFFGVVGWIMKH